VKSAGVTGCIEQLLGLGQVLSALWTLVSVEGKIGENGLSLPIVP